MATIPTFDLADPTQAAAIIQAMQAQIATLTQQLQQQAATATSSSITPPLVKGKKPISKTRTVKPYKGPAFDGAPKTSVEDFIWHLETQSDMQGLTTDDQKLLLLNTAVSESAATWLRQYRLANAHDDYDDVITALKNRYQDRTKSERAFNRLNTIKQEGKVRGFNQVFAAILLDLSPRPTNTDLIRAYYNALNEENAELILDKNPQTIEEAMQLVEEREQRRDAHATARAGRGRNTTTATTTTNRPVARTTTEITKTTTATPMDIGQTKVTCFYCKKVGHLGSNCPVRPARVHALSTEDCMKKGLCFTCGKSGHLARECPQKTKRVAVVEEVADDEINVNSQYKCPATFPNNIYIPPYKRRQLCRTISTIKGKETAGIQSAGPVSGQGKPDKVDAESVKKSDRLTATPFAPIPPKTVYASQSSHDQPSCPLLEPRTRNHPDEPHPVVTTRQPFVIKGTIAGHPARILIDSGSDLDCISQRFVKRHNLPTRAHQNSTQVRAVDGSIVGNIDRNLVVPVALHNNPEEQTQLDVLRTNQDAILGAKWLRSHRPQFDWDNNTMVWHGYTAPFVSTTQIAQAETPLVSALTFARAASTPGAEIFVAFVNHVGDNAAEAKNLPPEIQEVLDEFQDVFPPKLAPGLPPDRGTANHSIPTVPDAKPFSRSPYRLAPAEMEILKERIKELIAMGHIRPSSSPWGAPVLFVKKKDGTLRMCVDYRALNKLTIRNEFPLPRIDELFDALHGAKFFTALDLDTAYHQIRITPEDIPKTGFICPQGHYEFLVMTFGFTNAPATFQTLMTQIFYPHLGKFVTVYLDDILIFSKTLPEHVQHLKTVLQILRDNKLYAKEKKCTFAQTSTHYLGHIVDSEGLHTDPAKTRSIQEWPAPTNPHEIRIFLGMCNYYRKFIPHYADLAAPLNELLRKDQTWTWTPNEQLAFETLKQRLQTTPVLSLADPTLPYRVETDCSDKAIGAVLKQKLDNKWHPIAYESRKLNKHELNYPIHEKELLALVHALRTWRHYLLGLHFEAYTDHQSITYLLTQPQLSQRQVRWTELLADYDVHIQYRPGTQNIVADALSRRPDYMNAVLEQPQSDFRQHLVQAYPLDPDFAPIYRLKDPNAYDDPKHANRHFPEYRLQNGILYMDKRICIPNELRATILKEVHDIPTAGHPGIRKTYLYLRTRYYWPNMKRHIERYIRSCDSCQRNKTRSHKPSGLLQPLPVPNHSWESCSLDFVTKLPKTQRGHTAIMIVVDRLSKMTHLVPTRDDATAEQIARLYLDRIYVQHGLPTSFISDRDSKFTSQFWTALYGLLGTSLNMSSARHPESDGQSERTIRTIRQYLRTYVSYNQKDWDLHLPLAEFCYNSASHSSTQLSPFEVVYGRQPHTPLALAGAAPIDTDVEAVNNYLNQLTKNEQINRTILSELGLPAHRPHQTTPSPTEQHIANNIKQAQEKYKKYADQRRIPATFQVGDQVLLATKTFDLPQYSSKTNRQLGPKYLGPYKIIAKIAEGAYKLELPPALALHPVFHASQLQQYHDPTEFPDRPKTRTTTDHSKTNKNKEITKIIDKRTKKGTLQYLVQWEGSDDCNQSWIPAKNLESAHHLILQYEHRPRDEV